MRTPSPTSRLLLLILLSLLGCAVAGAAAQAPKGWQDQAGKTIKEATARLDRLPQSEVSSPALAELRKSLTPVRDQAQSCIDDAQAQLKELEKDIATLGAPAPNEDRQITKTRKDLTAKKAEQENRAATCRLLLLNSQDLLDKVSNREQTLLAARLFARGPDLWQIAQTSFENPAALSKRLAVFLADHSGLRALNLSDAVLLILLIAAAIVLGRWLATFIAPHPHAGATPLDSATGFVVALRAYAARRLPILISLGVAAAYLSAALPLEPLPLVTQAVYGLAIYYVLAVFVNVLLVPIPPAESYLPLPSNLGPRLARRIKVLLVVGLIGYLLFGTGVVNELAPSENHLARAVYAGFLLINLIWIVTLLGRFSRFQHTPGMRTFAILALVLTLAAEWAGYRNLADFLFKGLMGTALSIAFVMLLGRLLRDTFDGLDNGRLPWQKRIRKRLGLKDDERMPGLVWIRFTIAVLLWSMLILLLLYAWGLSERGAELIRSTVVNGFQIGTLKIVPSRLVVAVLVFALLVSATRWLKQQVVPAWLTRTSLDRGAREAITTISGYAGVSIALLVGLSMAGITFTSLAIVAGALSVGIGFGLQNIVNNFVSGLILLFERPIRAGDWIVVGSTEGYVKEISIRSTRLETFDRAEVIIPNSELATTQVTNWLLRDAWGRIIVPVGVAYGSDTRQVEQILLDLARKHELVMVGDPRVADPMVLFREFGDSSLNFELRCFIRQVDQRLRTISDLNFAIDAAFREANIEIPFPQRDLHLRSMPEESGQGSGAGDQGEEKAGRQSKRDPGDAASAPPGP